MFSQACPYIVMVFVVVNYGISKFNFEPTFFGTYCENNAQ